MHPESIALVQSSQPLNGLEIDIRLVERASRQVWNGVLSNQLSLCTNTFVAWKSHSSQNHAPLLGIDRGISTKNTRSCCMRAREMYRVHEPDVKRKKIQLISMIKIDDEKTTILDFYHMISNFLLRSKRISSYCFSVVHTYQNSVQPLPPSVRRGTDETVSTLMFVYWIWCVLVSHAG